MRNISLGLCLVLGGPVALEAARIMPDRVIGVIGVDTLHDASRVIQDDERWNAYVGGLRESFKATCEAMVAGLFHEDAPGELVADVRSRICDADPPPPAAEMVEFFHGYDLGAAMKAARVPVRSLNGDLFPINMEANTKAADYDAVVMEHAGHYPMLERPQEFDEHLAKLVAEIAAADGER
jgi:pimeloyl-ACP methyl ester carboxylesterase